MFIIVLSTKPFFIAFHHDTKMLTDMSVDRDICVPVAQW